MKRVATILALVLCLVVPILAEGAPQVLSTTRLNLRSCPGTQSCPIIRTLSENSEMDVLEQRGDWLHVRVLQTDEEGWVHSAYTRTLPMMSQDFSAPSKREFSGRVYQVVGPYDDDQIVGRVGKDGAIYRVVGPYDDDEMVGRVDSGGKISKVEGPYDDAQLVGRVDAQGRIYKIEGPYDDEQLIGRVDATGRVYKVEGPYDEEQLVGRVEAPTILAGGPALLILFSEDSEP